MLPIFNKIKEQDIPSFNQLKKEEKELPQAVEIKMVESSEQVAEISKETDKIQTLRGARKRAMRNIKKVRDESVKKEVESEG